MAKFEDEIQKNGYIAFQNEGTSMMPLLEQHKDVMVIRKITEPLKKNDAVLFKRPNGAYVMHRIIKVLKNGKYRIAGDNRFSSEIVPKNWIIGILTEVIKGDKQHILVQSDEYEAYLKKVPLHRLKLKLKYYPQILIRKISRTLRGAKK